MSLRKIDDRTLLARTQELVREERRLNLEVLRHLREIAERRLFLKRGHPSLFEMCLREFKYSPAAAQRRIEAMRLLRDLPEVEGKIEAGAISLSVAAQVQTFFRQEAKKSGEARTAEQKLALLEDLENRSSRDVGRQLAALAPELPKCDRRRWVSAEKIELRFEVDADLHGRLERLKNWLSHKNPRLSYGELLEEIVGFAEAKLDPAKTRARGPSKKVRSSKALPTSEVRVRTRTRFIPKAVKAQVWREEQGRCGFVDGETGVRCESRHLLQIDHIIAYSQGGSNGRENLRLLCAGHNRDREV